MEGLIFSFKEQIAYFDWNMFYGVDNETELEDYAANYAKVQAEGFTYIFAGVVFPDITDDQAELKNVTVKIRMNTTYVHETDVIRAK